MDLGAVMQEIADELDTIADLRVYGYPADSVNAPAAIVTYPGELTYDGSYGRGMDRIPDLTVVVLVGKVSERTARDRISQYCNGSGSASIKAVVEAGTYTEFDTVRVASVSFDIVAIAAVEYLAATFTLDIAGQGA
ncbi:hypothetical protein [Kribbella speibonae]|uniref:Tail terminator n=1 Tax=Kribbella speibonae TaxID=1572660 RepID=A0ABY2AEK1_9ACTN|nr:hypothetical protein [Kribbella speibonae]TCC26726.1 hypothetical protein E0H58_01470 [Kribbella speibonae]